nr:hypothetical protein GCM10020093_025930 [Planobispora longispora]
MSCPDLAAAAGRWPNFASAAAAAGFAAVHALPMGCRDQAVGALILLHTVPLPLEAATAGLAGDLAQAAAIGLAHRRAVRHHETVTGQLRLALNSRVLIEQAKGLLAGQLGVTPDEAFVLLRDYARAHQLKLTALSRALIQGEIIPVSPREWLEQGGGQPRMP